MELIPKISVIMQLCNGNTAFLESIESILNQSFSNFELILVGDISNTFIAEQVLQIKDPRIKKVYHYRFSDKSLAINAGLKVAIEKYICFAEEESIWVSDKLTVQFNIMESRPRFGAMGAAVASSKDNLHSPVTPLKSNDSNTIKITLLKSNPFNFSTLIFKNSALKKHNLFFKVELKAFAFYDFMERVASRFATINSPDILSLKYPASQKDEVALSPELNEKLRISQLRKFGLRPSKSEIVIHGKLIDSHLLNTQEVDAALKWVNKLLYANKKISCYNNRRLRAFFKQLLIDQLNEQNTGDFFLSRTDLLTSLIKKFNYSSYLEVGVFDPKQNFDLIKCINKTGKDPEPARTDIVNATSDVFFANLSNNEQFDLIFIDGLHHSDQVSRDIKNALDHISKNGTVVCHDMLPENEEMQIVPRQSIAWMGDCWKAWAHYRTTDRNLNMFVVDSDCGMGVIRRGRQNLFTLKSPNENINYAFFKRHKKALMNVISTSKFQDFLANSAS